MVLAVDKMEESLSRPGSEVSFEIRAGSPEEGWRKVQVLAVNCLDDARIDGVILRARMPDHEEPG